MKAFKFNIQRFVETINGTAGHDNISVTAAQQFINALGGNDTIRNHHAYSIKNDITISGGDGADSILSGFRGDYVSNNNSIIGGAGNDWVSVVGSNATISGDSGDDYICASLNSHLVNGGVGDDYLEGYGKNITILGETGNDTVYVNGSDYAYISGGEGEDILFAGGTRDYSSNDGGIGITIDGGNSNDYIRARNNTNGSMIGGSGDDTIVALGSPQNLTINGGAGNDSVSLASSVNALVYFNSSDGNDTIYGFNEDDTLQIAGSSYSTTSSSNDVIVTAGNGKITLVGATGYSLNIQTIPSSNNHTVDLPVTVPPNPVPPTPVPPTIPTDALTYNGHSYYVYSNVAQTWEEAQEYCKARGGYLAVINNSAEDAALFNYIQSKGHSNVYFGLSDGSAEGSWEWVNGDSSTYRNWADGEPNGSTYENYGMFYSTYPDGKWNDGDFVGDVSNGTANFICEWDSVSNAGGGSVKSYQFYSNVTETISAANASVKSSYTPYEQVNFHTELKDFEMKGDNLIIYSNTGSLTIANVRGQNMTYGDADGNVIGYSYVSGTSETIDRRNYSKFNVVIGADNADNVIYAGSGGSNMWGGSGGKDTLIGNAGYDLFNYRVGSGDAGDNDLVNLNNVSMSQIVSAKVDYSEISATFADGGSLKITGNSKVGFLVDGVTYYVSNRSTGAWSTK